MTTTTNKDETTTKTETSTNQGKGKTSNQGKKGKSTDKDKTETTETKTTDNNETETTDNDDNLGTPVTKGKKRKGKINQSKVTDILNDISKNKGLKNKTIINQYGVTSTTVSKIKKSLHREWIQKTDETPLPVSYYTGKSINDFIINSMFDKGWIPKE